MAEKIQKCIVCKKRYIWKWNGYISNANKHKQEIMYVRLMCRHCRKDKNKTILQWHDNEQWTVNTEKHKKWKHAQIHLLLIALE